MIKNNFITKTFPIQPEQIWRTEIVDIIVICITTFGITFAIVCLIASLFIA